MQLATDIMKDAKGGKDAEAEKLHLLDRQFNGLGMQEMTPLDQGSTEFTELATYLKKSGGHTHNLGYKVQHIFRIERQGEYNRFNNSEYANIENSDRRLLWHGSRCTNFGGILSQGLRIAPPEAPVSGKSCCVLAPITWQITDFYSRLYVRKRCVLGRYVIEISELLLCLQQWWNRFASPLRS